jgi:hypothetical protein
MFIDYTIIADNIIYGIIGDDGPFAGFIAERVAETQKDLMRMLHMEIPKV